MRIQFQRNPEKLYELNMDLQEVNILINIRNYLLEKNDKQKLELVDNKINALLDSPDFINFFLKK